VRGGKADKKTYVQKTKKTWRTRANGRSICARVALGRKRIGSQVERPIEPSEGERGYGYGSRGPPSKGSCHLSQRKRGTIGRVNARKEIPHRKTKLGYKGRTEEKEVQRVLFR